MAKYCVWSGGSNVGGAIAGATPTTAEWSAAYTTLGACFAAHSPFLAGDTVFVASDHAATTTATTTLNAPSGGTPVYLISLSRTTGLPVAGASETGTNGFNSGNSSYYAFGISYSCGGSSTNSLARTSSMVVHDACSFSGIYSLVQSDNYSSSNNLTGIKFKNSSYNGVGSGSKSFYVQSGDVVFEGCSFSAYSIVLVSGAVEFHGCDLSAMGASAMFEPNSGNCIITAHNCKVGTGAVFSTTLSPGGTRIEMFSCSSADHNYNYYSQDWIGTVQADTGHYLTTNPAQIKDVGGSLVSYSLSMAGATGNVSRVFPLYTPWSSKFNALTGSRTVSVQVAYDSATALLDADLWMEVEYLGDTTSPKSTVDTTAPEVSGTLSRNILAAGTALTDPATAWTGTFTNKKTATLSKTVTIQNQGYVRVRVGTSSTVPVYVDPTITVV